MADVAIANQPIGNLTLALEPCKDALDWLQQVSLEQPSIFFPAILDSYLHPALNLQQILDPAPTGLNKAKICFQSMIQFYTSPQTTQKSDWAIFLNKALFTLSNPIPTPHLIAFQEKIMSRATAYNRFVDFESSNANYKKFSGTFPAKFPFQCLMAFGMFGFCGLFAVPFNNRVTFIPGLCLGIDFLKVQGAKPVKAIWTQTKKLIISAVTGFKVPPVKQIADALRQDYLAS
ncbi:hypothetical protein PCANC_15361 [Puccinia coronata f. sp. avenae]|uniref:Uncharacterized protein n=1 Tax=Puccinia coronata f. sp. avenae TaxID=200324 RepID=A0A2N5SS29_9BASI|nr:hypothetical protein PCANC_15361 [Puccinia coronata f. sp. avenae]